MMLVIPIVAAAVALLCWLLIAGLRNGDRPGDAAVTATLAMARQPDGARPVILATVANRSAAPVLVGLRARGSLTAGALKVRVPWRTLARRYRAGEHDTVGVVLGWESAVFRVPVRAPVGAGGRRYRLTAIIGQSGRRLRVLTVPVATTGMMERVVMNRVVK
jgi:hypothetical protein